MNSALLESVAKEESAYGTNPGTYTPHDGGVSGIMQLQPGTAQDMGVDPTTSAGNIMGGAKYLSQLQATFGGDLRKTLAAYNWGQGNVLSAIDNYGANWLQHAPAETQGYVSRVLNDYSGGR